MFYTAIDTLPVYYLQIPLLISFAMRHIKVLFLLVVLACCGLGVKAQIVQDPASWSYSIKEKGGNRYEVVFKLKLKEGWHIWSLSPGGDGLQVAPSFNFDKQPGLKLVGSVKEAGPKKHTGEMDGVDGIVNYYEGAVTYTQLVEASAGMKISGKHRYQVCDDKMCLAPKDKKFTIVIGGADSSKKKADTIASFVPVDTGMIGQMTISKTTGGGGSAPPKVAGVGMTGGGEAAPSKGLLWLFLAAFGGGLLAVTTPCVYSMIPITVSFFTKRSKSRQEGIRNAFYYSGSIILIFTLLGILISVMFGANALNNLSTNWIANLFFFLVFVVFGLSFLGAFEITLPSSWTSKTDSRAGTTSFGGIFFMALTLVIVSFSCTGPIVGPLLVLAGSGGIVGPSLGMFAFSLGLSLPFALFAVFPGALNKMATSGGWLNQIKVFLGFVELMLALKFLSNADLARGWRLVDREVFLSIWIVLSILIGLYLIGKLRFSHDDAPAKNVYGQEYVSLFKLFVAIGFFSFAVYMAPGLWGAPLKGLGQFLPPMGTQDFSLSNSGGGASTNAGHAGMVDAGQPRPVKWVDDLRIYEPEVVTKYGLVTYYDYQEALAASKILKKPIMLDFTGINCVNCRKMESQVWSHPEVMRRLKEDFIVASLYCDFDKISLPEGERHFSKVLNADVETIGDANEALQAEKFGANSQPFYFFVDGDGKPLTTSGYGYDPSISKFVTHLEGVKSRFAGQGS
jgi:thiol:disulfide interchange protein DsbD